VSPATEESFEVSRFSLGLEVEPGWNRADKYTLEECVNLDLDEDGALVTRKGCRRVVNPSLLTNVRGLLVTDVEGVPTVLLSGAHATEGGSEGLYQVRRYALFGGGLGSGDYSGGSGAYARAYGLSNDEPLSTQGWRFVYFRGFVYLSAGNQVLLDTGVSTNPKTHSGMFRWQWHNKPTSQAMPLQDWAPDGVADLLAQDESLPKPRIIAGGIVVPMRVTSRKIVFRDEQGAFIVAHPGLRGMTAEEARQRYTQPVAEAGAPALAGRLTAGHYYYVVTYLRSLTLGESVGYELDVQVSTDGMHVAIDNIPTHTDPSVDVIRVYRNVSPTEPELRLLSEIGNGEASFFDRGEDVSLVESAYHPLTGPPTANAMVVHQGRLWTFGATSAGNLASYSEIGAPENFSVAEGVVFGAYPGPRVVAAASVGVRSEEELYSGPLLVFTPSQTYALVGQPPEISIRTRSETVGCQAEATVAQHEHRVFWLGANGVYASDGNIIRRISAADGEWSNGNIDGRLSGIPSTILAKACAAVAHQRYYLSVQDNRSQQRVFVFDLRRGIWTEREYPFTITSMSTYRSRSGGERLYAATSTGEVFELEVGDRDQDGDGNWNTIDWRAKLNPNWFGNKGQTKRFRRVRVVTDRSRDITFRTYVGSAAGNQAQVKQTKVFEAPEVTEWDGFSWDDGTTWVARGYRVIREGLSDANVGLSLQSETAGSGPGRVASVAVDIRRLRS